MNTAVFVFVSTLALFSFVRTDAGPVKSAPSALSSIIETIQWILRMAFRTIQSISCIIESIVGINSKATKFVSAISKCDTKKIPQVAEIVNTNNVIIAQSNSAIKACNASSNRHTNNVITVTGNSLNLTTVSKTCNVTVTKTMQGLYKPLPKLIRITNDLPTESNSTNCVTGAVQRLINFTMDIVKNAKKCVLGKEPESNSTLI